jgi:hypothetical protein
MEKDSIDIYLTSNAAKFESSAIPLIRNKMERADDNAFIHVQSAELKDPTIALILSLLTGIVGVDRFYIGDIGMGVLTQQSVI